ncbi:hypothetical protein [Arthrobacter sp. ISL-28]|uniref:hypothetical protein n=1 Tax=Arthrobacter sp. ISL-28 TaxID=2819108 RepID=UPI001BEB959C|nr:hypothetical protein [Arthrobacter sp. ISL-28]MBT2522304.1 hypothetical protein [Arthrobacter sp. ISL-28]
MEDICQVLAVPVVGERPRIWGSSAVLMASALLRHGAFNSSIVNEWWATTA